MEDLKGVERRIESALVMLGPMPGHPDVKKKVEELLEEALDLLESCKDQTSKRDGDTK